MGLTIVAWFQLAPTSIDPDVRRAAAASPRRTWHAVDGQVLAGTLCARSTTGALAAADGVPDGGHGCLTCLAAIEVDGAAATMLE